MTAGKGPAILIEQIMNIIPNNNGTVNLPDYPGFEIISVKEILPEISIDAEIEKELTPEEIRKEMDAAEKKYNIKVKNQLYDKKDTKGNFFS